MRAFNTHNHSINDGWILACVSPTPFYFTIQFQWMHLHLSVFSSLSKLWYFVPFALHLSHLNIKKRRSENCTEYCVSIELKFNQYNMARVSFLHLNCASPTYAFEGHPPFPTYYFHFFPLCFILLSALQLHWYEFRSSCHPSPSNHIHTRIVAQPNCDSRRILFKFSFVVFTME